jgi:hypothetical protein
LVDLQGLQQFRRMREPRETEDVAPRPPALRTADATFQQREVGLDPVASAALRLRSTGLQLVLQVIT